MKKINPDKFHARMSPFTHWLRCAEPGDTYLLPLDAQRTNVESNARRAGVNIDLKQVVLVEGTRTDPLATAHYLVRVIV